MHAATAGAARRPALGAWVVAAFGAVVLVAQVLAVPAALRATEPVNAHGAATELAVSAGLALLVGGWVLLAPARFRWVPVAGGAAGVAFVLAVGAYGTGGPLGLVPAVLTLAAAWEVGNRLLTLLGVPRLAAIAPVCWLAGTGVLATSITLVGRAELLRWWSVSVPVGLLGAVGLLRLGRLVAGERRSIVAAVTGDRLAAAVGALILLWFAWVAAYGSVPDMGFDALLMKAWLSEHWAETGRIAPELLRPTVNVAGSSSVMGVPGHLVGAHGTNRWMQFTLGLSLAASAWWWARRHGALGPLAGLAAGTFPHLLFQGASGYDDLWLALGLFALAVSVVVSLEHPSGRERGIGPAIAVGVLTGSAVAMKMHVAVLAAALATGWCLAAGRRGVVRRFAVLAAGAVATGALPFVLRWVDHGNPLFPTYNALFRSPDYPPVNEAFRLPYGSGRWIALTWPLDALGHDPSTDEGAPAAMLGLLFAAFFAAVVLGPAACRRPPTRVLWAALAIALVAWTSEFRYLRLLLPHTLVALALVTLLAPVRRIPRTIEVVLVVAAVVQVSTALPGAVATFAGAPDRAVPLGVLVGRTPEAAFERLVFPQEDVIAVFNRMTPPGTEVLSSAWQRTSMTDGRGIVSQFDAVSLLRLDPAWEDTPATSLRGLDALGVRWAIFQNTIRRPEISRLIEAHGEIVFADRGWLLYRLVEEPAEPRTFTGCGSDLRSGGCWSGPIVDAAPGVRNPGELAVDVAATVPTCPGQTVVATVGGGSVGVSVTITDGGRPDLGAAQDSVDAEGARRVAVTVSESAVEATVYVNVPPGGRVGTVEVGVLGPSCG